MPVPVGHEVLPESYFCQRFFIAQGQLFLNRGLPEYSLRNNYAAITLLRATSYLSRGRLRSRGGGAGPWFETPEANCLGTNRCEYAWSPLAAGHGGEPTDEQLASAYKLADLFEGRLIPFAIGKFQSAHAQSIVEFSNPAVYLAASFVEQGKLYLRVLNVTHHTQKAEITVSVPIASAGKVNLYGDDFQPLTTDRKSNGRTTFNLELTPSELVTIALTL
jgi:hypothetical protein